jgi:hypothetical protein
MGVSGDATRRATRAGARALLVVAALASGAAASEPAAALATVDAPPAAALRVAVHPGRPPLLVQLFAGDDGVSARVLDERTWRVVQEIPAAGIEPAELASAWLQDLNFDGFVDLALPSFAGATGNLGWAVWLFAPASGVFERNDLLSAASRLTPDATHGELTSRWNAGHAGALYTLETFRCPGGVPTLVRREKVDLVGGARVKTVEELRDGRLVEVERTESPADLDEPAR